MTAVRAEKPQFVSIAREYDARRLNAVLNHPAVRPDVADAGEGVLDMSAAVADRRHVLLMGQYGGCFFMQLFPGVYEVHTQVLPEGRGGWAAGLAQACAYYMFTQTDAFDVLTKVPEGHVAAKALTLGIGFKYEFTRQGECRFRGHVVPVHIYSQRLQDWASKATYLEARGEWFHERLNAEAKRLGVTAPAHDDDPNHNLYVGVALEMALAGQLVKSVLFYNRWAMVSRHRTIELLAVDPPTIRMDLGILKLIDGDVRVELPQ